LTENTQPPAVTAIGGSVETHFIVTNTGNIELTDIRVTDPHMSDVACPFATLAPGASMTCIGTWGHISAAELGDGHADDDATVTAAWTLPGSHDDRLNPADARGQVTANTRLSIPYVPITSDEPDHTAAGSDVGAPALAVTGRKQGDEAPQPPVASKTPATTEAAVQPAVDDPSTTLALGMAITLLFACVLGAVARKIPALAASAVRKPARRPS
jgi:hypothetical protein